MGRTTVYNNIVTDEKYNAVCSHNKNLLNEFIQYNKSIDRSPKTVKQYNSQLKIFFVWNMEYNDNKPFYKIRRRDYVRYFGWVGEELKASPSRIISLKAALSSLSNYIERFLDDEEEYSDFRNVVKLIESPTKVAVRKKTVFTQDEIDDILHKLVEDKKYQIACCLALAVASGSRKSELTRFKCNYFDDKNIILGCMYITPEEIKTKGRGKLGKPLKKYTFINQFKPYFDLWMNERSEIGVNSEWLFVRYINGEWIQATEDTLASWAKTINNYTDKPFYFHANRHLWTTNLKRAGIPSDVIKELQGWESEEMVGVYSDIDISETLGKYFNKDGVIKQEQKNLSDL